MTTTVRMVVIGFEPDLDTLAWNINTWTEPADEAVLLYIPGDSASAAAATMWTGQGFTIERIADLPTTTIVASLRIIDLEPDVVLVCQPIGSRDPLAAAVRQGARHKGITVRDLPRA